MKGFIDLEDVVVFAPLRNDGRMLASLLATRDIQVFQCDEECDLAAYLDDALPGALIVTQEALTNNVIELIRDHLGTQPDWSELSIVILVEKGASQSAMPRHLSEAWQGSRQIFYERPLAAIELVSGVQSALLARLRQRDVRDHLDLERELRHELNHRVKNILASVNSIFQMTARSSGSLEELRDGFGGRLKTLGDVHAALFEAGGETLDLRQLATLVLSPYSEKGGARFEAAGPPISLNKDATSAFGLVIHELATNAIKYGAWSGNGGTISLRWETEGGSFRFRWSEAGGPHVRAPSKPGYGTRYVRMALRGLMGREPHVAFEQGGMVVEVEGPIDRIRPRAGDQSGIDAVDTATGS